MSYGQACRYAHKLYGKTFKYFLFWNQNAIDIETWYAALVTQILQNLLKWCPSVDLDLFYSKVKYGPICF